MKKSNCLLTCTAALCSLFTVLAPAVDAKDDQIARAKSANLLFNGSLDLCQAVEIVPGFFLPKPLGWANVATRAISGPYEDEMSSEPWSGPAPTPVTTNGNANPPPPGGCGGPDCGVFFKPFSGNATAGAATGHLYQDNPATPGLTYTLTGWAGAEANVLMETAEFAIEFFNRAGAMIGSNVVDLIAAGLLLDNGEPFDYKEFTVIATAPPDSVVVRARASMINATANPAGGGQAFVIDDFSLTTGDEPVITGQPQSRTNTLGSTATFSVAAAGGSPLGYHWRKGSVSLSDGAHISGATTPTLTLSSVLLPDAGDYSVVASNSFGSVTSIVATLTVVTSSPNLLFNGHLDFCQAVEIVTGFFLPKPLGWINAGTRTIGGPYEDEMSSEPWSGPAPTPVTTNGNANPPPPEGCGGPDCGVFFKPFSGNSGSGPATGHLYQDNPATPGMTYVMTGWAGAEANAQMARAEFAIEFFNGSNALVGSNVLNLVNSGLFVDNGQAFDYKQYTLMATAPSNAAIVRVRASMIDASANPIGGGQAFVIDDFELSVLPVARPRITLIARVSPGGGRRIVALGEPNRNYVLEAASTLPSTNSWSNLGNTNANASGVFEFMDNAAGFNQRFYRLLAP